MAKTHPYILPGYAPMAIAPYEVEPTSSPVLEAAANSALALPLVAIPPEPGTSLMVIEQDNVIDAEFTEAQPRTPTEGGLFASNDDEERMADPFATSINLEADRRAMRRRVLPMAAMFGGIVLSIGSYAFSGPDLGNKVVASIARDNAIATPVKMTNGMPLNMAPLLDVYYQPQPLKTDRVVVETDANGCEWKVAFDGSVNIPKGRYPSLNAQNLQKCTDTTRAARPAMVRVARGNEPQGKPGTSIAIVNVIDPATGMTDRQAFAAFKGDPGEVSVDKATIDSIIKSELARAQKSSPAAPRMQQQMASRTPMPMQASRYPGIEYRNRPPTMAMPSMPGSAGANGDDKPTYIPYIPGMPYTPPASLGGQKPLRSIKPKVVAGGVVQRQMVPQMQSAKPGGDPTQLRAPVTPSPVNAGPTGTPSGNPLG